MTTQPNTYRKDVAPDDDWAWDDYNREHRRKATIKNAADIEAFRIRQLTERNWLLIGTLVAGHAISADGSAAKERRDRLEEFLKLALDERLGQLLYLDPGNPDREYGWLANEPLSPPPDAIVTHSQIDGWLGIVALDIEGRPIDRREFIAEHVIANCWLTPDALARVAGRHTVSESRLSADAISVPPPESASSTNATPRPRRRGAPPKYDWPDIRAYALQCMQQEGEFRDWDQDGHWKVQADLERRVMEYLNKRSKKGNKIPAVSSVRRHIADVIKIWRENNSAEK